MNINSRWWDVTLIAACLATVLIALFDEKPGALSPLVPLGMGVIVLAHLAFGRRALRQEDTPLVQVYTVVLVVAFGVAMAGSGTAAISQTVIYPVLWAMSSTWMRGVIRTVILGSALVVGSGLGRGDWIEGSITALISVVCLPSSGRPRPMLPCWSGLQAWSRSGPGWPARSTTPSRRASPVW